MFPIPKQFSFQPLKVTVKVISVPAKLHIQTLQTVRHIKQTDSQSTPITTTVHHKETERSQAPIKPKVRPKTVPKRIAKTPQSKPILSPVHHKDRSIQSKSTRTKTTSSISTPVFRTIKMSSFSSPSSPKTNINRSSKPTLPTTYSTTKTIQPSIRSEWSMNPDHSSKPTLTTTRSTAKTTQPSIYAKWSTNVDHSSKPTSTTTMNTSPVTKAIQTPPKPSSPAEVIPPSLPAYLHHPSPDYPILARRRGQQGKVILRIKINPSGQVKYVDIHQSSGHPILDEAALKTVQQWRFKAATQAGQAIEAWINVPITFQLK